MFADIATIITEKCVHPSNSRHFTIESIKAAMHSIHYPVKLDQPAKRQALECIKLLQKRYKIMRAMMKIKISLSKLVLEDILKRLEEIEVDHPESEEVKEKEVVRVYFIEPAKFREINTICKKIPGISIEVLTNVVSNTEIKDVKNCCNLVGRPISSLGVT
jgi:ribosome maturation protein Sdo1